MKERELRKKMRMMKRNKKEDKKMAKFDHLLKGYERIMKRMIFSYGKPVATISQG